MTRWLVTGAGGQVGSDLVAVLTGSKNALKGAGFFAGGLLLSSLGFRGALAAMAGGVFVVLVLVLGALPASIGQAKKKAPFQSCFVKPLMRKTRGTIIAMSWIMSHVKRLRPWSKLVGVRSSAIEPAMLPR